jgi:Fe-Mn family superoxide dismutase
VCHRTEARYIADQTVRSLEYDPGGNGMAIKRLPRHRTTNTAATPAPAHHVPPPLPYAYAAMEPTIDSRTMKLHHDKHHATYVEHLNDVLEKSPDLQGRTPIWLLQNANEVPEKIRTALLQNAGGHVNHSLFWRAMTPNATRSPTGSLGDAIVRDFGSVEQFKRQFVEVGEKHFGSGWAWLVRDGAQLRVVSPSGHDNPLTQGCYPILLNDVWEHAYYLKYENRHPDYSKNWWTICNWKEANRRFEISDHFAQGVWEDEGGALCQPRPNGRPGAKPS